MQYWSCSITESRCAYRMCCQLCEAVLRHSSRSLKSGEFIPMRSWMSFPDLSLKAPQGSWDSVNTKDTIGYAHSEHAACHHGDWHVSLRLPDALIGRHTESHLHGSRPELKWKPLRDPLNREASNKTDGCTGWQKMTEWLKRANAREQGGKGLGLSVETSVDFSVGW